MSQPIHHSSSPLLASKTPVWRSKLIVAMIAVGFASLGVRAAYIQVVNNDFYQKQGEVRFARVLRLPASRGQILDRNDLILASSVVTPSIWAVPGTVDESDTTLKELARLLEIPFSDLKKRLNDTDTSFVWLRRQVDQSLAERVSALNIKGIYQRKEYKREYPEGDAASTVVGGTDTEGNGIEGMELAGDKVLSGVSGKRKVIHDRLGRKVEDVGEPIEPLPGKDLQLSIDSKVQFFAYQKIRDAVIENKARAGSVVVIDAITGEVLAATSYPVHKLTNEGKVSAARRNLAFSDTFEPGSAMKPFTIALALETGRVKPSTVIQTAPGSLIIAGSTIKDAHPHGPLTVEEIIQKSSNVGTVKIAMQMPAREMWEVFSKVGFGQRPKLQFPGLATGKLRPYKSWRPIEQATMSYGYGLSASLFQMTRAYTVFATDGRLLPATLYKTATPAEGERVFSPETALEIRKMLQMAAGPGGTGPKAQTDGYSVGGKSGTAHKLIGKAYADNKYRSWFVGLSPISKPRIVVGVMLDEPSAGKYFGGDVAAPVFSATVAQSLRTMGVHPDLAVKPSFNSVAVPESF
jgi:cell division protein FtsI (penicillin-binding protein 3)